MRGTSKGSVEGESRVEQSSPHVCIKQGRPNFVPLEGQKQTHVAVCADLRGEQEYEQGNKIVGQFDSSSSLSLPAVLRLWKWINN